MRAPTLLLGTLFILQAIESSAVAESSADREYAAAVIVGDNQPDSVLPRWHGHEVMFRIIYVGNSTLLDQLPSVIPARAWIEEQLRNEAHLSLTVVTEDTTTIPKIDVAQPIVDLLVLDEHVPSKLDELGVQHDQGTERIRSRGLFNCELARWQNGVNIVKAVGVLHLTSDIPSNVKCVSMALLYGLGFGVTSRHFGSKPISGVMTSYLLDPSIDMTLPTGVDIDMVRLLYSGDMPADATRSDALKAILRLPDMQ